MRNPISARIFSAVVVVLFLTGAPIAFGTDSGPAVASESGLVTVNKACGQATECFKQDNYICSTHHDDYMDYACTAGCSKESLQ